MLKNTPIVVLLSSLLYSSLGYTCDKAVDPNKVMLFIDTNLSLKEVEVAKKGACDRGERFILHPDGELADKARRTFYNYLTKEEYYNNKCKESTPACDRLETEVDKLKDQMNDYDFEEYRMSPENIKKVVASVKEQKASISTLIVSGHDGGGEISGDYISGSFTKNEFFEIYEDVYGAEGKNDLHSILLWGCYTGTYSEASAWKEQFPKAKAIVGFYDSAPLATRPASADLMLDFLQKEHELYAVEDEKELKKSIQNLKSILYTQPGILINACHDEEIYYSHFQDGNQRKTFYLTPKDADAQCRLIQDEWKDKSYTFNSYMEGSRDIPDNIRGSDIRVIYGLVRQNEKCFKDNLSVDANKVGLLLFYNGVRENFTEKYAAELEAAQKEIDELASMYPAAEEAMNKASKDLREQWDNVNRLPTYWGDSSLEESEKMINESKDKDDVYKELYRLYSEKKDPEIPAELREKLSGDNYAYYSFNREMKRLVEQRELKPHHDKMREAQKNYDKASEEYRKWSDFSSLQGIKLPVKGVEKYPRSVLVQDLRKINNVFPKESYQKIKEKYPNLEKVYKKMDQLLYQLDPTCMNFLEWHQFNANKGAPRNQCEDK